jgi:arylsulfatase A-like enzyme
MSERAPSPSILVAPPVAEQVVVGCVVSVLTTLAEGVVTVARGTLESASPLDVVRALLHVGAMTLPLGLLAAIPVGITLGLARKSGATAPLRARFATAGRLFARDPSGFSGLTTALVGVAFFVAAVARAAEHFATAYHDPELASYAMALATLGIASASLVLSMMLARPLRAFGAALGPLGSTGVALVLVVLALGAGVVFAVLERPDAAEVYDPVSLAWLPGIAVLWVVTTVLVRARTRRKRRAPSWWTRGALALAVIVALAIVASGTTYGGRNRVRAVLEQHTITGLHVLRLYARLTDRDGDGHSFAFGGGDCDDSRARVYPGAPDAEGDGVDADCFGGDGTPPIAPFGDGRYGAVPSGLTRPNILLITIDTLRADHVGCYGYERDTTPRIDALCEEGVRFDSVVTQSTRSLRSFASLLTGLYASQVAYGPEYLFPTLLDANVTVAEALRARGYRTGAVMGSDYFARAHEFFQGFDSVYQDPMWKPPRNRPVDRALPELRAMNADPRPFFLWVHLMNVHANYLPDGRQSRYGGEAIDCYDEEVRLADDEVGRLLDALAELGIEDETVVAIASDHGEAFGEHQTSWHAQTLYEEEVSVALVLRIPHVPPRVVEGPVALIDLMPTLLNVASVPLPTPLPSESLLAYATGEREVDRSRMIFSELMPEGLNPADIKAVRRGDEKLIWWVRDGTVQLFDLARDPGERNDLSDDRPESFHELEGALRAWVSSASRPENENRAFIARHRLAREPSEMTHRLDLSLPGFTVLGFDLPETQLSPGDTIALTFYYRVEADIDEDYFFYVDITRPPGFPDVPHFHGHHYPLDGRYHTDAWRPGEILSDPVRIVVPPDARRHTKLGLTFSVLDEARRRIPLGARGAPEIVDLAEIQIR